MSWWLASAWPANALRRKIRHHPAIRLRQVAPGRADGNAGVLDARMRHQPVANGTTGMAGQVVGDQVEIALWIRLVEGLQQLQRARRVARGCRLGQHVSVAPAQRPVDPDFVPCPLVIQGRRDAGASGRPAGRGREIAWGYRAEFIDADDPRLWGRLGVERDDPRPFGTKSGSLLVAHRRVRRQRTRSWRKMRRT
jgi:hypothetical protein